MTNKRQITVLIYVYQFWCFYHKVNDWFDMPLHYHKVNIQEQYALETKVDGRAITRM